MIKKFITIFFLLLFITQVLPLRQVGQLIAKATMTEELPDSGSSKTTAGFDGKWIVITGSVLNNSGSFHRSQYSYIHFSETLPFRLASDIQTPPPDLNS
ncbi:MAG: hypothetical protein M3Z92_07595 [Bacteroidota bacterium]|nr:hypothetical protein [Bacteroidota bacterium]